MKAFSIVGGSSLVALGLTLLAITAGAADEKSKPVDTNSVLAVPAPKAVFNLNAPTVKDPFFPLSTRSAVPVVIDTNAITAPPLLSPASFKLNGVTLSDFEPLAIVNNHSIAKNEPTELMPLNSATKVRVTVLEIDKESATIRVDGYPDTLRIYLRDR